MSSTVTVVGSIAGTPDASPPGTPSSIRTYSDPMNPAPPVTRILTGTEVYAHRPAAPGTVTPVSGSRRSR
ncbi:hypothetical protein TPA0907_25460 [Micromonospora humidisoli]|nr:hypothetical protein TPA0907_25460 [Micromonospora sp. AKA109]